MIQRTTSFDPAYSEPCPRLSSCTYKAKGPQCEKDRGGDCYRWFLAAGRYVDEERGA